MIGLRLLVAQFKAYWRLRAKLANAVFRVNREAFSWRSRVGSEADSYFAIGHIFRATSLDIAKALAFTAVVWWSDRYAALLGPAVSEAGYVQLTSAIAAIGGVFIGLYYAAITAAMTSVYASMPAAVSQLLLQERYGNAYMQYVATLTFTAIALLALESLGIETKTAGTAALALGSGIAVFGFVKLGTWAFQLFNPTAVSAAVLGDIHKLFKRVVAGGYKWREASFQKHAHDQCMSRVTALRQLAVACEHSPHLRNEALVRLTGSMLSIARFSVTQRPRIPTKSLWFPQSYSQPEWYRTTDDRTAIAHHTGMLLTPGTVSNAWWLERDFEDAVLTALRSLLARGELTHARPLASALESYVDILAKHGWVKQAVEATNRFEDAVIPATVDRVVGTDEDLVARVALLDYIGRMRITSVLRAADWADTLGRDRLDAAVRSVDWLEPISPYELGVHAYAVETAEWLAERLAFERLVRSVPVTPHWYCSEMLALRDAESLKQAIDGFSLSFVRVQAAVTKAVDQEARWEAACLLSDALHYVRKLQVHLSRLQAALERVSTPRRVGFTWPEIDFAALERSVENEYGWTVERMAELIPQLPAKPKDLPDYPGQFLHTTTERTLECVLKGDAETLRRIFPGTFVGCLSKHDELRVDVRPNDPFLEGQLAVAFAPIVDLVEVSGYSYLLSEAFPDRQTWPDIARVWDAFLAAQPELADQLLRIISFAKQGMSIHPRAILRANWDRDVAIVLRQLPVRRVARGFASREEVDHPSPLIRAVVHPGRMGLMDDGSDVFAAMYLLLRPGAQQALAHPRARELARRTAAEHQNNAEAEADE